MTQVENVELLTDWQRRRAEYKQRKRLTGGREKETLAKLKQFQAKMQSVPSKLVFHAFPASLGSDLLSHCLSLTLRLAWLPFLAWHAFLLRRSSDPPFSRLPSPL